MIYKVLKQQVFSQNQYSIVPIREEDRFKIMEWRNEQMYHLRQAEPLTKEIQDHYFKHTVAKLFEQEKPNQILFSFLNRGKCIGYGGLVHINWKDKNAEISFLMQTESEKDFFEFYWATFLKMIEKLAFEELKFHKIYTYAYDLRPKLFSVLASCDYLQEVRLREHVLIDNEFVDAIIHSKLGQC